jgi:hypothetical protein
VGGGIGGQVAAALLTGLAAAQAAFATAFWAIAGVAAAGAMVAAGIRATEPEGG